ncbi:hypothetical protein PTMSG1_10048 [Pyrenophora teres f. maculata]|nr:hypothetical protein PTMSG1_10048 [Pyrenophora teres f. maculata]
MENTPEWEPIEFQATGFDQRSKAYRRQQNAYQAAPVDGQQLQQQPPSQPQPQPQSILQPQSQQLSQQPQRTLQGEQQGDRQSEQQGDRQAEQYGVRQEARSHSQYQELQRPLYVNSALRGAQPRRQREQAPQSQQWHPQTQTRPLATTYREITPFPQQPTHRISDRPPDLPHDLYKTLPPR